MARYLKNVSDITAMLRAGEPTAQAAAAIRELIASVTVTPTELGQPPRVNVQGKLEALIGMEDVAARQAHGRISGSGDWDRTSDLRIMIPPL